MLQYIDTQWMVEQVRVEELAERFGTPLYVYSMQKINDQIDQVIQAFDNVPCLPGFACKANGNIHLLHFLAGRGLWVDVVSMGEYHLAREAGVKNHKIVVNGNAKNAEEMEFFLSEGVYSYNIDSREEYRLIQERKITPNPATILSLRVNPDVDPHTHPYISTGLQKNKFGISTEVAAELLAEDTLGISGLHSHIGSNIFDVDAYLQTVTTLLDLARKFPSIGHLNLGGGWGIDYGHDGKSFPVREFFEKVVPLLRDAGLPVMVELGRFLVGPAGILLCRVLLRKKNPLKEFVVLDTNMAHLIRPALYQAKHHVQPLISETRKQIRADIVGGLCETGDVLALDRDLPEVFRGELLAIEDVGAYGFSMSSNYNGTPRPAEVAVLGSKCKLIRKRESFSDLYRLME